ncbi:MAG: ABC transporter substrate-binding protein [Burkholderiales bacterium]|nr:ABC transporter substrate-binding protein [Burkholderiales bacterium]
MLLAGAMASSAYAQTLTIGVRGGPDSIDPHFTATGSHAEALKHVFDTLVWSGDGLELQPRLAESWRAVNDTTWEFKLRKGVKFHDGSDFTAQDVKFSIERIPTVSGPNPTTIYVRRVKDIRIIDTHTLLIITDGPAPTLPNDFIRLFIVSSKAAAGLTKENANEAFNSGKAAIGTGPYKFVSWQPKGDLVLDRFPGYWGPKEPWSRHVRKEIPNDAARVAQLKAGQLDLITRVPATDVAALKRDPKVNVQTIDTVYVFNIEMDMRDKALNTTAKDGSPLAKNPFLDLRVRQAIDLAIDRKGLADVAMEGLGKPASQMVTPSIFGYNKALPERIGIETTPNAQPVAVFFPARTRGEYSMSMSGWGTLTGESHYTLSSLAHSNDKDKKMGAFNVLNYNNPEMDKLLQDAAVEMDVAKRRKLLESANALVDKDKQRLPIVAVGSAWAMQKGKVTIKPRVDEDTLAMNIKPVK